MQQVMLAFWWYFVANESNSMHWMKVNKAFQELIVFESNWMQTNMNLFEQSVIVHEGIEQGLIGLKLNETEPISIEQSMIGHEWI